MAASVTTHPPEASGLYFLIRDDQIVYVGSSEHPSRRCYGHERCAGKEFDGVVFLAVDEAERIEAEKHWIRTLSPVHNKAWNPRPSPDHPGWGADPDFESRTRPVRIPESMACRLDLLCRRNETTLTKEVKTAVRLYLESKQLWPPS